MGMGARDVVLARRAAGADRPDRLVGDDQIVAPGAPRAGCRRAGGRAPRGCAGVHSSSVSPMHRIGDQAGGERRLRPWRGPARSLSPWPWRRSEWPTITSRQPASLSIAALMSPVWAPLAALEQSWPPSSIAPSPSTACERASRVAGGQMPSVPRAPGGCAAREQRLDPRDRVGAQAVHLPIADHDRLGQGHRTITGTATRRARARAAPV